jgi:hypothetical protein
LHELPLPEHKKTIAAILYCNGGRKGNRFLANCFSDLRFIVLPYTLVALIQWPKRYPNFGSDTLDSFEPHVSKATVVTHKTGKCPAWNMASLVYLFEITWVCPHCIAYDFT